MVILTDVTTFPRSLTHGLPVALSAERQFQYDHPYLYSREGGGGTGPGKRQEPDGGRGPVSGHNQIPPNLTFSP